MASLLASPIKARSSSNSNASGGADETASVLEELKQQRLLAELTHRRLLAVEHGIIDARNDSQLSAATMPGQRSSGAEPPAGLLVRMEQLLQRVQDVEALHSSRLQALEGRIDRLSKDARALASRVSGSVFALTDLSQPRNRVLAALIVLLVAARVTRGPSRLMRTLMR